MFSTIDIKTGKFLTENILFNSKYLLNLMDKNLNILLLLKYNKTANSKKEETWIDYCLNTECVTKN